MKVYDVFAYEFALELAFNLKRDNSCCHNKIYYANMTDNLNAKSLVNGVWNYGSKVRFNPKGIYFRKENLGLVKNGKE